MRVQVKIRNLDSPNLTEQQVESSNISARGVYFSTDLPLDIGARVEMFLTMPVEIAGKDSRLWRCTGASFACNRAVRRKRKLATESRFTITKCSTKRGRRSRIPGSDVSRSRNSDVLRCTKSDAHSWRPRNVCLGEH